MSTQVVIRRYDVDRDHPSLRDCIVEQQNVHRGLEPTWPDGSAMADEYLAYLDTQCAAHNGCILIAQLGQQVVGFACVVASMRGEAPDDPAPFAWIYDVYVKAAQRRHGVASLLTAEAERFARAAGAPAIRLGVLDRNEGARAFYARRGFRDYTRILTKPLSEAG